VLHDVGKYFSFTSNVLHKIFGIFCQNCETTHLFTEYSLFQVLYDKKGRVWDFCYKHDRINYLLVIVMQN